MVNPDFINSFEFYADDNNQLCMKPTKKLITMFKVDTKTLKDAQDSIRCLTLLLAASHQGKKLKISEVDKAIVNGMASVKQIDTFLNPKP